MIDVTDRFLSYREQVRHLWNGFRQSEDPSFDVIDQFKEIQMLVMGMYFGSTLMNGTGTPKLLIKPIQIDSPLPILVQRMSSDRNHYWDEPQDELSPMSQASFGFIDLFDWDTSGYRDFQFVRGEVLVWPEHPHLAGREALLQVNHSRFFSSTPVGSAPRTS
jgi:hypothetical protein